LQEPISKIPNTKRAGGVAQDVGPVFKPQYCKQNKTKPYFQLRIMIRHWLVCMYHFAEQSPRALGYSR
jgi:hypothetical protein